MMNNYSGFSLTAKVQFAFLWQNNRHDLAKSKIKTKLLNRLNQNPKEVVVIVMRGEYKPSEVSQQVWLQ